MGVFHPTMEIHIPHCAEPGTTPSSKATSWGQGPGREARKPLYLRFGKRVLDTLGALAGLVITSPVLFLCGVAIWVDSRGPIFFCQKRVGQHGRPFQIIKLRTMIIGADKLGSKLTASGDRRITRVGKFLRKTKLDEIPQLLNVLRGEMSLVGPRPEVPEYIAKYSRDERRVLDVKPGITGPASLAYVDEERLLASCVDRESVYVNIVMRHKLQVDLAYYSRVNLLEDLRVIFLTAEALLNPGAFGNNNAQSRSELTHGEST